MDSVSPSYRLDHLANRLSEPLHLNALAAVVALFGSYRSKVKFDLVRRRQYAYSVLRAADLARRQGLRSVTVVEFGVASGNGLLNLCKLAELTTKETGVSVNVVGFDTGKGLPPPSDYRDHPELFQAGDFPMDFEALAKRLPENGRLTLGPVSETVSQFIKDVSLDAPLGFAAIDVDYYSSARDALRAFSDSEPKKYLPLTLLYLDDIADEFHNSWCGELLAVEEFNRAERWRKIEQDRFLRSRRVFKNANWLDRVYFLHVLDHPLIQTPPQRDRLVLSPISA